MNDIAARQLWITATRIRSDTEILTWSRDNGYGIPFRIYDTTPRTIKIYSATIKKPRLISQKEFLKVTSQWHAYRDGETGREVLTELSQNTSYMFGILKWMEDQNE
jgi:hypothetical protein